MTELDAIEKEYGEKKEAIKRKCELARERIKTEFSGLKSLSEIYKNSYEYEISSIEFALCEEDKLMLRLTFHDNHMLFFYIDAGGQCWLS